jgi:hypothetical protein
MSPKVAEIWNDLTMPIRATQAGSVEHDAARSGLEELGQQVEHGALAGTIGADQRMDPAVVHIDVNIVDGKEGSKTLGQTPCRSLGTGCTSIGRSRGRMRDHGRGDHFFTSGQVLVSSGANASLPGIVARTS